MIPPEPIVPPSPPTSIGIQPPATPRPVRDPDVRLPVEEKEPQSLVPPPLYASEELPDFLVNEEKCTLSLPPSVLVWKHLPDLIFNHSWHGITNRQASEENTPPTATSI